MALVEAGMERPSLPARWAQDHLRVLFFSLGKIGRAPIAAAFTALVIGIALALPAGLYVATQNLADVAYGWQSSLQISLYLKDGVSAERGAALARELDALPGVGEIDYISRERSLKEFREKSGFGEALDLLDDNPLPAVIAVTPAPQQTQDQIEALVAKLAAKPEVELAKLDREWLDRLYAMLAIVERSVGILAVLLGVAVLVIVGNTIRLDIESRREEIEVMKLIGAPDRFIRRPFLYTGFWYGLGGGLLAWVLVSIAIALLTAPSAELAADYDSPLGLTGLSPAAGLGLVAAGIVLGWVGALVTVSRRLASIQPK